MSTIKERVSGKQVTFTHYQNGELWYACEDGFTFPVPITDTGNGAFKVTDKAIYFMRWIRQHMNTIELAKLEI